MIPECGHERGQASVLLVAGMVVVLVATLLVTQVGVAFVARGRLQRSADLAALSAATKMGSDHRRLFTVGEERLSVREYAARARAAAIRSLVANGAGQLARSVTFSGGFAPDRVRVTISGRHEIEIAGDRTRDVAIRAAATARVEFRSLSPADPLPGSATGGGYGGPLAYRQGKPMRPDVALAFDRLDRAARVAGHALVVTSGFRSDAEQARLFARRPDPKWVAPPGTSLHRYGTELDIGPSSAYGWLDENARAFGFVKRYAWEPWHFGIASGHTTGRGVNPRDVPAQYERGSYEPPRGHFRDGVALQSFVPRRYDRPIAESAQRWNVQPELLAAQLFVESRFDPLARSPAGALGIAQFMPATAASVGLRDPFDPVASIDAQAKLMASLIGRFRSVALALAAYNAGPRAVVNAGGVPAIAETQSYVARVFSLLKGDGSELGDPAFAGLAVTARSVLVR